MKKPKIDRRQFLYGLGSASLFAPLLPSLLPRALAQTARPPKRMVFIMNRNGQFADNLYPNMAMTQLEANVFQGQLNTITGNISPIVSAAYNGLKNKISLLRGLDITTASHDHNRVSFLTGASSNGEGNPPLYGASIDWLLENSTAFYPTVPRTRAIRFSIQPGRGFSWSRVNGTPAALPYISTDQGLFNNVFSGFNGGPPTANIVARRQMAADKIIERITNLKNSRRISSTDKQRLQQHTDTLTQLKTTFVNPPSATCTVPTVSYFSAADLKRKLYTNVNDIIVAAFTCDITRIACIYIEDYHDTDTDYSYFHGISHADLGGQSQTESATHNRWIAERVADLITKLDSITESDGTKMLDNTLVMWGSEICAKQGAESHRQESIPTLLAGGSAMNFRQGYYLDYRTRPFRHIAGRTDFPAMGRPITQLLASIMLAGGLQRTDFETYGQNGKFGQFDAATGTYYNGGYDMYAATRTDKIPYLYTG